MVMNRPDIQNKQEPLHPILIQSAKEFITYYQDNIVKAQDISQLGKSVNTYDDPTTNQPHRFEVKLAKYTDNSGDCALTVWDANLAEEGYPTKQAYFRYATSPEGEVVVKESAFLPTVTPSRETNESFSSRVQGQLRNMIQVHKEMAQKDVS